MSRNYSCGQFEDSFKPKNLKIWAIGDFKSKSWSNSTIYSRSHKRRTDFICDDRGHLLPGVQKDPSTTWGQDVKAWVWEESSTTQNLSLIKKFRRDFRVVPSREVPKYFPKSPPRVQCTDDLSNFKLFLHRKVPILWIFGQPQVDIDQIRKSIVLQLVRFLGYTYIDMEYEIIRWKLAGDVLKTNPKLLENGGRIQIGGDVLELPKKREDIEGIKRAIRFSTKLVRNPEESLNPKGVIECLRLALAQHFPAKGYIIDGFPFSEHEAALFEEEFYEVSAGIYFMSSNYSKNPQIEPQTIPAALFRRDEDYFEKNVNEICDKISHKTIKIWSTEDMTPGHIKLLQNQVLKLTQDLMNINYPQINYLTNTSQNQNQTGEETENCFIFRPKIEYLRDKVDPEYPQIYYPSKDNEEICAGSTQTPPFSAGSSIVSVQVDEILQTINECMSPESFYTSMGSQEEISDYESNWDADHYHGKLSNEKIQLRDRLQLLSHGSTAISSDYFGDFCSETGYNFNENDENDEDSDTDDDLMLRSCFSRKRIDGSEDDSDFDSDFKEPKIDSHTNTSTNTRSRSVFDHLSEYSVSSVSQESFSISTPLLRHTESTKSVQNFENFKNLDFDFGLKRRGSKRPVSQDTQYTSSCSEDDEPENSLQLKSLIKPFSSDHVYESDEKNSEDSLDFDIRKELGSGDQVPRYSQNDRYYSPNQSGDWVENNLSELNSGQNSPISNRINRSPFLIPSSATSYCSNSNRNRETTKYRSDPYDYDHELPPEKRPNIFKFSNLSKSNSFSPISPNNGHNQKNLEQQRFLSEHILTENGNTNNQSNNIKRTIICRKRGPHGRLLGVFLAPKTANNNRQIIHRK